MGIATSTKQARNSNAIVRREKSSALRGGSWTLGDMGRGGPLEA